MPFGSTTKALAKHWTSIGDVESAVWHVQVTVQQTAKQEGPVALSLPGPSRRPAFANPGSCSHWHRNSSSMTILGVSLGIDCPTLKHRALVAVLRSMFLSLQLVTVGIRSFKKNQARVILAH